MSKNRHIFINVTSHAPIRVLYLTRMYGINIFAIPQGALIAIIAVSAALIIGIGILLYFTVFAHFRARKQVRELVRRFEYLHALVFGQDSQFVKRLEIISRTNLLYVNVHMNYNRRYREIKDRDDAMMTASINRLKDMSADRKWKELKAYFPIIKNQIATYESRVNTLNSDLMNVIKPEEECRQECLALKEKLRKVKQDYYVKQADLTLLGDTFEAIFTKLEQLFQKFETLVESAQYDDAKAILPTIAGVIDQIGRIFPELPNLCATIQTVIPDKLVSLKNRFEDMMRQGYPLHHLISIQDIDAMENQLTNITKRLQGFDLRGIQNELDGIIAQISDYMVGFDKEEEARTTFETECDTIYAEEAQIEKKYIKLCNSLPAVKRIFVISGDEQAKIDSIKVQINRSGATKRSLDTFIHSGTHQPYSLLVERMHQLRDEANQAQNAIDDFERYLLSLKADSEESLQCIKAYYEKLRDAESNVRDINLEAVDNRYKGAIDHLYGLLDSAYKVLSHTPIDVYKLDSLIAEIKGSGDEVVANILNDKTKMALAEAAIVFANRDRNHLGEVDTLLQQTEGLYFSGDFNRSYEETLKELKRRHAGE